MEKYIPKKLFFVGIITALLLASMLSVAAGRSFERTIEHYDVGADGTCDAVLVETVESDTPKTSYVKKTYYSELFRHPGHSTKSNILLGEEVWINGVLVEDTFPWEPCNP